MTLRVAANLTTMYPEHTLLNRFRPAKSSGFSLVEVSLPYAESAEDLKTELTASGLKAILINSDPGNLSAGEMGWACAPSKEDKFKESLNKSLLYAKALNVHMIHIMVGKSDSTHSSEAHQRTLESNLQYAAALFQQEGVVGVIEPKNTHTFPGYYLDDYEKAVSVLAKVDSPHMRLLLDVFHMQLICGNITNNITRLMPYTAHVQVSQPPARSEPSSSGELDYVYIIQTLKDAGYKGYIGAEYRPSTKKTEDSLQWITKCGLTF